MTRGQKQILTWFFVTDLIALKGSQRHTIIPLNVVTANSPWFMTCFQKRKRLSVHQVSPTLTKQRRRSQRESKDGRTEDNARII